MPVDGSFYNRIRLPGVSENGVPLSKEFYWRQFDFPNGTLCTCDITRTEREFLRLVNQSQESIIIKIL